MAAISTFCLHAFPDALIYHVIVMSKSSRYVGAKANLCHIQKRIKVPNANAKSL
jgi:hypothetical protein